MAARPLEIVVVPHTHWDREWYLPAGRFRQRLVALADELLDAPPAPGTSFLFDGQAIVLEDYLAVRPERRDRLAALLRDGRIEAGPWYVLADELIPSGEALARNLTEGGRILRALGAAAAPVLYSPDAFGHPAALPLLAREFGCEIVVVWRGYGGARWPAGDAARWRAPDGRAVLLWHLPPSGYEFGSALPTDDAQAAARWETVRDTLGSRARLGVVLLQNGADHHARQRGLDEAIAALARAAAPSIVRRGALAEFARRALARAGETALPEISGELRDSYGYAWTLQGTFATRARQKRDVARTERLLERDVEPWIAIAMARGGPDRRPLLRAAWRPLLQCLPHDTLCGCSLDEVARAMDARLADAWAQGGGLREDSLQDLANHDRERARVSSEEWTPAVVVRNPAPRVRHGVADVELLGFLADVPVGPGSGGRAGSSRAPASLVAGDPALPMQLLTRAERIDRVESPRHYPDADIVDARRALLWVPEIPAYGLCAWAVRSGASRGVPPAPVSLDGMVMDNGVLAVTVHDDGRVSVRATEGDVASLIAFEDVADAGDLYTHSPAGSPSRDAAFLGARVVHRGPLRAAVRLRWRIPAAAADPARLTNRRRSSDAVQLDVELSLDAGARFLRLRLTGHNGARDHRTRIVLDTGVREGAVWADAAFGPVRRVPVVVPAAERATEAPPPTAPLHRWVSLDGEGRGATVYADGLAEYEATPDGEVAITLVRAVGELSRADLPERPGHAGWPAPTPDAQSIGAFAATLAFFPHGPRTPAVVDAIERVADDVLVPLRGETLRSALAIPDTVAGVELVGDGLAFSACMPAERDGWLVLRCVNLLDEQVSGRWRLGAGAREATLARMDETPSGALAVEQGEVPFVAAPHATVTILVR